MKRISVIFCMVFALGLYVTPANATEGANGGTQVSAASEKISDKEAKITTKEATTRNSSQGMKISAVQEIKSEIKTNSAKHFMLSSEDLWENSAADFDEIFEVEHQKKILNMDEALKIIRRRIINRRPDQRIDQYAVFSELRKVFSEAEFSTEELMTFIEDALEIKKKYLLIFDFVIRSEYARRAVKEGVNADEVLQFASSEYIQLPKFIFRKNVDSNQLNDVLSDLGCGVVWKDRAKYMFVVNKYFGGGEARSASVGDSDGSAEKSVRFPRRVRNYLKLIEEVGKFFEEAYEHLVFLIAQDFYYADVPQEKIMKIFPFSDREWAFLVKPDNYQ